jgi:hypothetical protein
MPQTVAGGKSDFITKLPDGARDKSATSHSASLHKVKASYDTLRASLMQYIAAQQIELDTVGMTEAAAEAYRFEQEALNKAMAQGIVLTPQQREQIHALAQTFGELTARTAAAEQAQGKLNSARDTMRELGRSTLSGFLDDMKAGTSWANSLANALSRVADQLMQIAMNSLFDSEAGTSFFTGLAKLVGFADGGKVSGPGGPSDDRVPAMLSNGEFVVNSDATRKYEPLLRAINEGRVPGFARGGIVAGFRIPTMPAMASPGRSPIFNIAPTINVEGGSRGPAADRELADKISQAMEKTVRGLVQSELVEQTRPGNLLGRVAAY